ncbi:hypothetical protein DID80_00375, partial [Candidatus Marinamargulisbacteria bacterium SCGC AAA071-K20]
MNFKKTLLLIITLLVLVSTTDAKINYKYVVTNISIKGLSTIDATKINQEVNFKSIIGQNIRPSQLEKDIEKLYILGFFESISASSEINDKEHTLVITLKENPKIKQICIEGNTAISDKTIKKLLHSKVGKTLNFNTLQKDKHRLQTFYQKKGYSLFKILEISSDKATLFIQVSEGYVDQIKFEGLNKIRASILIRDLDMK